MNDLHRLTVKFSTFFVLSAVGCDNGAANRAAVERAEAQVRRVAADLDKRTTETGVYIRVKDGEVKETDPWGGQLQISYTQGGVAEVVTVRSAGRDRQFHTDDDVAAQGMAANLKGIGEGIKKNAEETAANAAKGLVKGTVEGVKESVTDVFRFNKSKTGNADPKAEDGQSRVTSDADGR